MKLWNMKMKDLKFCSEDGYREEFDVLINAGPGGAHFQVKVVRLKDNSLAAKWEYGRWCFGKLKENSLSYCDLDICSQLEKEYRIIRRKDKIKKILL